MGKASVGKASKKPDPAPSQGAAPTAQPVLARHLAHALDKWYEESTVVDLVPAQPSFLLGVDDFLSESECTRLIEAADHAELQPSSESDRRPKKGEAFLDRETAAFVDAAFADALWSRLRPHLPAVSRGTTGVTAEPLGFHGDGRGRGGRGREGVGGQL